MAPRIGRSCWTRWRPPRLRHHRSSTQEEAAPCCCPGAAAAGADLLTPAAPRRSDDIDYAPIIKAFHALADELKSGERIEPTAQLARCCSLLSGLFAYKNWHLRQITAFAFASVIATVGEAITPLLGAGAAIQADDTGAGDGLLLATLMDRLRDVKREVRDAAAQALAALVAVAVGSDEAGGLVERLVAVAEFALTGSSCEHAESCMAALGYGLRALTKPISDPLMDRVSAALLLGARSDRFGLLSTAVRRQAIRALRRALHGPHVRAWIGSEPWDHGAKRSRAWYDATLRALGDADMDVRREAAALFDALAAFEIDAAHGTQMLEHAFRQFVSLLAADDRWEASHGVCEALERVCRRHDIVAACRAALDPGGPVHDALVAELSRRHGTPMDRKLGNSAHANAAAFGALTAISSHASIDASADRRVTMLAAHAGSLLRTADPIIMDAVCTHLTALLDRPRVRSTMSGALDALAMAAFPYRYHASLPVRAGATALWQAIGRPMAAPSAQDPTRRVIECILDELLATAQSQDMEAREAVFKAIAELLLASPAQFIAEAVLASAEQRQRLAGALVAGASALVGVEGTEFPRAAAVRALGRYWSVAASLLLEPGVRDDCRSVALEQWLPLLRQMLGDDAEEVAVAALEATLNFLRAGLDVVCSQPPLSLWRALATPVLFLCASPVDTLRFRAHTVAAALLPCAANRAAAGSTALGIVSPVPAVLAGMRGQFSLDPTASEDDQRRQAVSGVLRRAAEFVREVDAGGYALSLDPSSAGACLLTMAAYSLLQADNVGDRLILTNCLGAMFVALRCVRTDVPPDPAIVRMLEHVAILLLHFFSGTLSAFGFRASHQLFATKWFREPEAVEWLATSDERDGALRLLRSDVGVAREPRPVLTDRPGGTPWRRPDECVIAIAALNVLASILVVLPEQSASTFRPPLHALMSTCKEQNPAWLGQTCLEVVLRAVGDSLPFLRDLCIASHTPLPSADEVSLASVLTRRDPMDWQKDNVPVLLEQLKASDGTDVNVRVCLEAFDILAEAYSLSPALKNHPNRVRWRALSIELARLAARCAARHGAMLDSAVATVQDDCATVETAARIAYQCGATHGDVAMAQDSSAGGDEDEDEDAAHLLDWLCTPCTTSGAPIALDLGPFRQGAAQQAWYDTTTQMIRMALDAHGTAFSDALLARGGLIKAEPDVPVSMERMPVVLRALEHAAAPLSRDALLPPVWPMLAALTCARNARSPAALASAHGATAQCHMAALGALRAMLRYSRPGDAGDDWVPMLLRACDDNRQYSLRYGVATLCACVEAWPAGGGASWCAVLLQQLADALWDDERAYARAPLVAALTRLQEFHAGTGGAGAGGRVYLPDARVLSSAKDNAAFDSRQSE